MRKGNCVAKEATVTGVILLVFLALLVAWIWRKVGGKAGFKVSNSKLMGVIAVFIVVVALLYATSQGH
jgi:hypothetical protein